ncbi:MAG TPA: ribosome small subunit-dependent GTPase A [Lachnospiraceae bacterium]|nr:ribosome small subunit-dependent GTPase A [Lachnospiraceae bacterium]
MRGRIIKSLSGFYYVYAEDGSTYACRARGIFRLLGIKPLVGDHCELEVTDTKDMEGSITEILPRKCELIRPSVSNIDQALVIFSLTYPEPNLLMLDKLLLQYSFNGLPSIICFSKEDLADDDIVLKMKEVYSGSGCPVRFICSLNGSGVEELKVLLKGKTTSVAGPSGVGKSTLINCLQDNICAETGSISHKSERGKQTTRHTEMIPIDRETFIMDTPGFSSFELYGTEPEAISSYYPEFGIKEQCYYSPCSHTHEPDCAVKAMVEAGLINRIRYDNYTAIYGELKGRSRFR